MKNTNSNSYSKPDLYSQKAKKEGYAARSVYKLKEIDEKYKIFKKKQNILDLGAFPGSWSQYALEKVGKKGLVVGIDIKNIEKSFSDNFIFFHQSILDPELSLDQYAPFDCVISDMAPNTSGIKDKDVYESIELSTMAAEVAAKLMKPQGIFVCKVFQGEEIDLFFKNMKSIFKKTKTVKPLAVRKTSKEIYLIGWGLKGDKNA